MSAGPGEGRIAPLSKDEASLAAKEVGLPVSMVRLSIFRVLLKHPRLAKALNDLLSVMLFEGALGPRLRELAIMRLGWTTGSVYEWTQHWHIARALGVPEEDLLAVRDWRSEERFGPAERAVLAAVDEVVATGRVSRPTFDALSSATGGDERVLIEAVAAIGAWRMVATWLESLEVPLEDGVAPWPPDGTAPPGASEPRTSAR
jgi:alkylhydroperoxidase family enzyme